MAAFQQFPTSFLVDSVFNYVPAIKTPEILDEFFPNLNNFYQSNENSQKSLIIHNREVSSIESSCLEQQSLSMADKADSGEQVTQTSLPIKRKRKSRKGSSPNSAISKQPRKVKCKKQKEEKEVTTDEKKENNSNEEPPKGYIHVRARRGQATDSHSLAERVRREKISERMKMLQAIVPGCNKVTGKALMLDEIINYVQSLQNQVEFLSMKLASLDPMVYNFGLMDHNPMVFGTQQAINNGMALPMPLIQPTSNGGSSVGQPEAFANNLNALSCSTTSSATTPTFPGPIVDSSANLFQQEQKPSLLPLQLQDTGSLYWDVNEQQRQNFINQFGFSSCTNLYSLQ
ncbi:hypothetical protein BVRB_5g113160 isoform B [Beta vulgaris subsp. vulgaris]|uniref:basic helix-loop-helix protein 80 isoform X1 n=1 Tax=Beta vulgaris subsp. vulgaris TaxID=3555 RepID=UPI00053FDED2|nr:basic helix-loop-helix protein 80 isoform X1 [Beta vulgaris subsp. vulgaris]XP_048500438.1 basic helix-loop-helix protein 80 isoform X1 [Beta vulgaris subsp. vulgaris]KMT10903.1 hypothetical protein BVRB_5g113160 isoform B [Beta vulgaris subsp. vulgaris]